MGGPKVIIVSVRILYISLYRYACVGKVFRGWSQSDYSFCPRPLCWVFGFSGFRVFRFLGFQVSSLRRMGQDGTGRGARQ